MKLKILTTLSVCFFTVVTLPALPSIDSNNRWQIRDCFQYVYNYGSGVTMDWTGNYSSGVPGTVSEAWHEATRTRVEYYRAMAGIPSVISFDEQFNAACQQAALMMSGNHALSHNPPANWIWYTADGANAASKGNLALGSAGRDAINGYMADPGSGNYGVGHRRWVLYPHTTVMGSGDVPGDGSTGGYSAANCLWVIPSSFGQRPQTRDLYVPWPPKGYVPSTVVFPRWSFSYPDADFSNATVSMESGGTSIPLTLETVVSAFIGERTIVWVPNGMNTDSRAPWPTPDTDETISVSINNVLVGGSPQSFNYDVIIFNPDQPGPLEEETQLVPPASVYPTVPATFAVTTRPWGEGVQGRILESSAYNQVHGAENSDMPFVATISSGYTPIQSGRVASGSQAYHLCTPTLEEQLLTMEKEFIVVGNSASLQFDSSLAWTEKDVFASVDINLGDGSNWMSIWKQYGPVQSNSSFTHVVIDLSAWKGKSARFRFRYAFDDPYNYVGTEPHLGWAFDNVAFSGVDIITGKTELAPAWGSDEVTVTFNSTVPVNLQAREFAFDGILMDWGPVTRVQPIRYTSINAPVDTWVEDPVIGWISGDQSGWIFSLIMGWIYPNSFPWIYTDKGWFYYVRGSADSILWLYHPQYGYAYTQDSLGGWFNHEPYTAADWDTFAD